MARFLPATCSAARGGTPGEPRPAKEAAYPAALGPAAENTPVTRLHTALRHDGEYPRASLKREFRLRRAAPGVVW